MKSKTIVYEDAFYHDVLPRCITNSSGVILFKNDVLQNKIDCSHIEDAAFSAFCDIVPVQLKLFYENLLKEGFATVQVSYEGKPFWLSGTVFQSAEETLISLTWVIVPSRRKDDIREQQQLKHTTMGEMISNIAHQWRQPLNILALVFQDTYIKYQLGAMTSEIMEKNYSKSNNLLQYMSQTIDDFRTFFRNDDLAPFEIKTVIETVQEIVESRFLDHNVRFLLEASDHALVFGTENGFKQVIINLLNNALEAIIMRHVTHGTIRVQVHTDANEVMISVEDNGGGIDREVLPKVFDPYFTTKHQSQGTGLGLYMSKQIIEFNMDGVLRVENIKNGARFTIALPLYKEEN